MWRLYLPQGGRSNEQHVTWVAGIPSGHHTVTPLGQVPLGESRAKEPLVFFLISVKGTPLYVQLTCVLFQETVPKARGGASQETRTGLPNGTAQTEAFGRDQTVLVLQPRAALRVRPGGQQESAAAEAPQVCWRQPEGSPSR